MALEILNQNGDDFMKRFIASTLAFAMTTALMPLSVNVDAETLVSKNSILAHLVRQMVT